MLKKKKKKSKLAIGYSDTVRGLFFGEGRRMVLLESAIRRLHIHKEDRRLSGYAINAFSPISLMCVRVGFGDS